MIKPQLSKHTYRLIAFLYVIAVFMFILECFGLIEKIIIFLATVHLSINYSSLSLIVSIFTLSLTAVILWDKHPQRAKHIAILFLVETLVIFINNIISLSNQTSPDFLLLSVTFIQIGIFFFFSLLLLIKVNKQQEKEIKLFPFLVITLAVIIFHEILVCVNPTSKADATEPVSMVLASIIAFVLLFTKFLYLYSSLSNQYVYRYFLQNHPRKILAAAKKTSRVIEL